MFSTAVILTFFQFSKYPEGEWDDDTKVNGDFTINANPNHSWVYSLARSYPNLPKPPGNQDHVFGVKPVNARLKLRFTDARKNVKLYLLYETRGKATGASIKTLLKTEGGNTTQDDDLNAGWTEVTYPKSWNSFELLVVLPDPDSHLFLAQVDYPK